MCFLSVYKMGNVNSYSYIKFALFEELRGFEHVESERTYRFCTQTTRSGFGTSDVEATDTSESFGLLLFLILCLLPYFN